MKIKFNFIVIAIGIITSHCFAQYNNYWPLGDSAAVVFANGNISYSNSSLFSSETSTSVCDSNGNLLLYSGSSGHPDSIVLFNKFHNPTPNGKNICGHTSTTQGTLILNYPGFADSLILLSQYPIFGPTFQNRVFISIISLSADSIRGDIISKNDTLPANYSGLTEKMIAIRHANGRDWWLILHEAAFPTSKNYIKYLITPSGISGPFIQNIPSSNFHFAGDYIGQMEATLQGDKIAFAGTGGTLDILDFDRCTGLLTMNRALGDSTDFFYGCCFSPDGNFVYTTSYSNNWFGHFKLFQFDLLNGIKDTLWDSPDSVSLGQLQIGPDNKIYLVSAYGQIQQSTTLDSSNQYLSVINYPDSAGFACGFVPYQVYLGGRRSFLGLPNIPNYNLGRLQGSLCDTVLWTVSPPAPEGGANAALQATYNSLTQKLFMNGQNIKGRQRTLRIFSVEGKLIYQIVSPASGVGGGYFTLDVDVSNLSSGMYLISLTTEKESLNAKFVKE